MCWMFSLWSSNWLRHRLTAHRALIEESANGVDSPAEAPDGKGLMLPGGEDNLAFETDGVKHRDKSTVAKADRPIIHFPHPPAGSPSSR